MPITLFFKQVFLSHMKEIDFFAQKLLFKSTNRGTEKTFSS